MGGRVPIERERLTPRTAEVEYCRLNVSFLLGDFERDLCSEERCRTTAVGRGPTFFRYCSRALGGLKINPETMILTRHSSLDS